MEARTTKKKLRALASKIDDVRKGHLFVRYLKEYARFIILLKIVYVCARALLNSNKRILESAIM